MSLSRRQFIQASGIALCAGAVPLKASAAGQQQPQNVRDLRQPFGGVKASGTGREGGEYSFDVFAEMKNVCISMGDHPIPKWGV